VRILNAEDVTLLRYLLDVDFNVLLQAVAVQIEDKVVNVVKTIADYDERQLIGQLRLLQHAVMIRLYMTHRWSNHGSQTEPLLPGPGSMEGHESP